MKSYINLFVLGVEIAAIIVLHTVKINQPQQSHDTNVTVTKSKISAPVVKHFPLLSIK